MKALAVDLDGALGDTRPLWRAWLDDAARRSRVELTVPEDRSEAAVVLDGLIANWRALLERFAEDHAPVYLRPNADATAALRRLQAADVRVGVFTDAPEELVTVALAHLGAARRVDAIEAGADALDRLRARLGDHLAIVRTAEELTRAAS